MKVLNPSSFSVGLQIGNVNNEVTFSDMITALSTNSLVTPSLVPTPRAPPGEKRSGEQSRISWAYSPKRWKTNEIARSLIITRTSLTTLISIRVSILFLSGFSAKMLLGYTVPKVPASPRNSTWFSRPFIAGRCVRAGHETSIELVSCPDPN